MSAAGEHPTGAFVVVLIAMWALGQGWLAAGLGVAVWLGPSVVGWLGDVGDAWWSAAPATYPATEVGPGRGHRAGYAAGWDDGWSECARRRGSW